MLSVFVALPLIALPVDFNFCSYWFGGGFHGFPLLGSGFRITALDFDIQAGGFGIFIGFRRFRGFRGFRFLGGPISQAFLRLTI